MNIGIYKSASALVALDRWQQAISQNIAAASVPGYRKTEASFESQLADTERFGRDRNSVKEVRGVMPMHTGQLNLQPGEIRATRNETDFAIQGRGFFKVQVQPGEVGYTRDGEFHLNAARVLVTKQGKPVLGENGPITFRPEGGRISITGEGILVQGEQPLGRLPVFDFKDTDKLQRITDGFLAPADPKAQAQQVANPGLLSGVLETSNVQPLREMVNLITVSRAYEANQRSVIANNELLEKAIQSLGSPSV